MDAISNMDFDYVASGHYAKVVHTVTDENKELSYLELSKDMVKMQLLFALLSYLPRISQIMSNHMRSQFLVACQNQ